MNDAIRSEFEEWYNVETDCNDSELIKLPNGAYLSYITEMAYAAWCYQQGKIDNTAEV
jgi:hypothetical protein